jgi:uncharacterized protein YciI
MLFAVWATDLPGMLPARQAVREAHRARLRAPGCAGPRVLLAGPLLGGDGHSMNGTLLIVEAGTIEAVRAFVAADPYTQAGVYGAVDIRPFHCGLGSLSPPRSDDDD